jgi:hypothetical protein
MALVQQASGTQRQGLRTARRRIPRRGCLAGNLSASSFNRHNRNSWTGGGDQFDCQGISAAGLLSNGLPPTYPYRWKNFFQKHTALP